MDPLLKVINYHGSAFSRDFKITQSNMDLHDFLSQGEGTDNHDREGRETNNLYTRKAKKESSHLPLKQVALLVVSDADRIPHLHISFH